jgi:hypothetical protein
MTEARQPRKHFRATLLFVGIAIQLLSLFAGQLAELPFVARYIAPKYHRASVALTTLRGKHRLDPNDIGYADICDLLRTRVVSLGVLADSRSDVTINHIESFGTAWSSSGDTYPTGLYFTATPTGGSARQFTWGLEQLQERTSALQQPNALIFALVLFGIGSALDIVSFYLEP